MCSLAAKQNNVLKHNSVSSLMCRLYTDAWLPELYQDLLRELCCGSKFNFWPQDSDFLCSYSHQDPDLATQDRGKNIRLIFLQPPLKKKIVNKRRNYHKNVRIGIMMEFSLGKDLDPFFFFLERPDPQHWLRAWRMGREIWPDGIFQALIPGMRMVEYKGKRFFMGYSRQTDPQIYMFNQNLDDLIRIYKYGCI